MIALILALALACFGHEHDRERKAPATQNQMGTTNQGAVSNPPGGNVGPPPVLPA